MKYIKPFGVILFISFLGELCNYSVPFPIPGSLYGLGIMVGCLCCKIIRVEDIKTVSSFLIEIMPMMFIPAAVELMTTWDIIRSNLIAYIVIIVVSTVIIMITAGRVTQFILGRRQEDGDEL